MKRSQVSASEHKTSRGSEGDAAPSYSDRVKHFVRSKFVGNVHRRSSDDRVGDGEAPGLTKKNRRSRGHK